jgi:LacI family transcriptional regulator
MEYVRSERPRLTVHSLALSWNDHEGNRQVLDRFFAEHPEVRAGVTFNSRAYLTADYLARRAKSDFRFLGYDLLEGNVEALKRGTLSYLIAQRPEQQGYRALRALASKLVFHQEVSELNFVPMDILMKENIDFYLNFPSI